MKPENDWMGKSKKYKEKVFTSLKALYGDGEIIPAKPQKPKAKALAKNPIPSEYQEQCAIVAWVKAAKPDLYPFLIKQTNEGKRTMIQGHHLKMMGMQAGASDLFLAYPVAKFAGLWLEIKRNRRYTPSEMRSSSWQAQIAFLGRMKSVGYCAEICYGFEDGKRIVESYLSGNPSHCNLSFAIGV